MACLVLAAAGLCAGAPQASDGGESEDEYYDEEGNGDGDGDGDDEVDIQELQKLVPAGFEIVEVVVVEEQGEDDDDDGEEGEEEEGVALGPNHVAAFDPKDNEVYGADSG